MRKILIFSIAAFALVFAFISYDVAQTAQDTAGATNSSFINFTNSSVNNTQLNQKINKSDIGEASGGTLSDSRLSSNIPKKDSYNIFTSTNEYRIQAGFILGNPYGDTTLFIGTAGHNAIIHRGNNTDLSATSIPLYIGESDDTGQTYFRGTGQVNINPDTSISGRLYAGLSASSQSNAVCYNSGTKEVTYNSGVTTCLASTESAKNNITPITGSITPYAMNLTPKRFKLNYESGNLSQWHVGFMAQDILNVTKGTVLNGSLVDYEIVNHYKNLTENGSTRQVLDYQTRGNITGVQYEEITALLLKVIQEQQTTLNKICTKNQTLCQ